MLRTCLKISLRNLSKNKLFASINVFSLVIGLAACVVIYLVAGYEFGFDSFHTDKKNIYRLVGIKTGETGDGRPQAGAPAPLAQHMKNRLPGIESAAAFYPVEASIRVPVANREGVKFDNKAAYGSGRSTIVAGPDYFKIMQYKWLAGNAANALKDPYQVVLTTSSARKFFGDVAPSQVIGRQLTFNDSLHVHVSGIVEDWDKQTDFPFTEFISVATAQNSSLHAQIQPTEWGNGDNPGWQALVKLKPATDVSQTDHLISNLASKNMRLEKEQKFHMFLQPLSAVHFDASVDDNIRKASKPVLYSLVGVGLFMLLLAVVNFINLATAQFADRTKEIGIRKILGSSRKYLVLQFLLESFVLTLLSSLIVILCLKPILGILHSYIPEGLVFNWRISNCIFFIALIVITTLLTGLYPARLLSTYSPVLILKGARLGEGMSKDGLRKMLIVFQFSISLVFIFCAIIVGKQLNYMLTSDFGFNADAVLKVDGAMGEVSKRKLFAEQLMRLPGVSKVSLQSFPPMGDMSAMIPLLYKGKDEISTAVKLQAADENFLPLYEVRLLAGRNLVKSDSINEFVINQSYANLLGFTDPADAIGKQLYLGDRAYPIVGVVADFHQASYREPISPQVILNLPVAESGIAVKLTLAGKNSQYYTTLLRRLEQSWKVVYPDTPFSAIFLDEAIAKLYEQEQKTAWLVRSSMITAVLVSCIGLFGLSVFMARKKTKEIGIRKVLGASVLQISSLLCREYLFFVFIAILIASPIAGYMAHRWLQGYAYRVEITGWTFVMAGAAALMISFMTIIFQSVKAGLTNPVSTLRSE